MASYNDWMQTATGKAFYPNTCRPEDFDIEDIAHALSNICRFGGHTLFHYSVAQHSVLVARACPARYALEGLMHDATEAYIGDLIRPIKHDGSPLGNEYLKLEERLEQKLAKRFQLEWAIYPNDYSGWPKDVKYADNVVLATEARDVMSDPPQPWHELPDPLSQRITPLTPVEAKRLFLNTYETLMVQRGQETDVRSAR